MYCTNTIFNDGSKVEDKGLFMDGLNAAKESCKKTLENNPEIKEIHLLGVEPGDNHVVTRGFDVKAILAEKRANLRKGMYKGALRY